MEKYSDEKDIKTRFTNNRFRLKQLEKKDVLTVQESEELHYLKQIRKELIEKMKTALFAQINMNMALRN